MGKRSRKEGVVIYHDGAHSFFATSTGSGSRNLIAFLALAHAAAGAEHNRRITQRLIRLRPVIFSVDLTTDDGLMPTLVWHIPGFLCLCGVNVDV
jgi:hypothetical protein